MTLHAADWSIQSGLVGSRSEWNNAVRSHVANAEFDTDDADGFVGQIAIRNLGALRLTTVQTNACRVAQKLSHDPSVDDWRFALHYIREGKLDFEQGNRSIIAEPGDFVLVDNFRSFTLRTSKGVHCVSMDVSEAWLKRRLFDPFASLMINVDKTTVWARTLGLMLTSMADTDDRSILARHDLISEQTGGFMTLLFGGTGSASLYRKRQKQRILETLGACFADPEISPASIAQRVGISKRSLHLVLAESGTTFGAELSRLRMGQARKFLSGEEFGSLSIAEIAWRCGFSDASYFTRCFTRREGCSPSMFRIGATCCPRHSV